MRTMFQQLEGAGSAPRRHRRSAAAPLRAVAAAIAVCGAGLPGLGAGAQTKATPVHFWAAGHVIPLTTSAVTTGRDTYLPLSALPAIGAHGTLGAKRDGVTVRLRSGRLDVLPFIRRNGVVMISLTDLAESANGSIIRPSASPAAGLKPNTAYLLAHITDVRLKANELRVVTSFPVPFVSENVTAAGGRGYVDCIGAIAARDFKPVRLPAVERRAERIRIGQFSPSIARVVVDLAPGVTLERNSTEGKVTPTFLVALEAGSRTGSMAHASRRTGSTNGTVARTSRRANPNIDENDVLPPSTHRRRSSQTIPEDYSDNEGSRANSTGTTPIRRRQRAIDEDTSAPIKRRPRATDEDTSAPTRSTTGTRTSTARTTDIRGIAYETQDNQNIQIIISTSRRARAYVRYSATARQVIIDIPNSRLNLRDDRQKEQDIQHPLVEGLTAATVQNSPRLPPLTRITIDAPRIVSTSIETDNTQIVLDITVPKSARNNRVRPGRPGRALVVVDAGHGGVMTGAKAKLRKKVVYEKDITLAIATRLRSALVAHGNRVVMTRVGDVNVPLQDRPRLANEVGAHIFISIHNDSWGKANSITGTTTYFHGKSTESRRLARCVERQLASVSGLRDRGAMSDTTLYPVGFKVLRDTTMPSVLCEVGYLNNRADRAKLVTTAFQQRVAEAVCNGINNYVTGEERTARRHAKKQATSA